MVIIYCLATKMDIITCVCTLRSTSSSMCWALRHSYSSICLCACVVFTLVWVPSSNSPPSQCIWWSFFCLSLQASVSCGVPSFQRKTVCFDIGPTSDTFTHSPTHAQYKPLLSAWRRHIWEDPPTCLAFVEQVQLEGNWKQISVDIRIFVLQVRFLSH